MIGILDGDIIMYRICWTVDEFAELYVVKAHIDKYMTTLLDKVGCTHYIGIIGIHGSNNVKYDVFPDYKRGRPADKPPHWNTVMNYLMTKWKFTCISGCETDDAIALCHNMLPLNKEVIIVSADKDLLQIAGEHFVMGVTRKGVVVREDSFKTITLEEGQTKFWTQMLTGDSVDNVKGLPGYGPKKAEKVLEDGFSLQEHVITEYKKVYGEDNWRESFIVNKTLLEISAEYAYAVGFTCPEPIEYKKQEEDLPY